MCAGRDEESAAIFNKTRKLLCGIGRQGRHIGQDDYAAIGKGLTPSHGWRINDNGFDQELAKVVGLGGSLSCDAPYGFRTERKSQVGGTAFPGVGYGIAVNDQYAQGVDGLRNRRAGVVSRQVVVDMNPCDHFLCARAGKTMLKGHGMAHPRRQLAGCTVGQGGSSHLQEDGIRGHGLGSCVFNGHADADIPVSSNQFPCKGDIGDAHVADRGGQGQGAPDNLGLGRQLGDECV